MHCATHSLCALWPPMQAALWGGIALHWAVHPVFTLGDDYCCRTLTPVTQRSPTPHPARHNPKYNSMFTAPGPHSQRSHLGFTHTGAVVQAAAGAAPEQLLPLFVSPDPTGRARLGRRPPADSVRGPLVLLLQLSSYTRWRPGHVLVGEHCTCTWCLPTQTPTDKLLSKHYQYVIKARNLNIIKTQITIALCNWYICKTQEPQLVLFR